MFIKKRRNLVHKFSSFIRISRDNQQIKFIWDIDLQLERSMSLRIEVDPDAQEIFWAQYFLKALLIQSQSYNQKLLDLNRECSSTTAKRHLSAYLQEACLKAAKDIYSEFQYIKHKYSLEEYLQIANIAASSPGKIFKNFDLERSKINISAYAITAFKRFIRNQIYRQDLEARRTKFSHYGLLKDLSIRELNEALIAYNFNEKQIVLYRLAWQSFNEIFQPRTNRLNRALSPSHKDLSAIASCYNQRCSQLNFTHVFADYLTIQEMLATCVKAAKDYRTKQYFCFTEDYDSLSDTAVYTWDILIQEEEWQQIQVIVDKLFTNIPQQHQIVFKLWQGLNLTQTEIANILKDKYPELQKQYQVARQLKRYTRRILKNFAEEWNQNNPEYVLDSEEDIERIKAGLEKCLQKYCKFFMFNILDEIMKEFTHKEQVDLFHDNQFIVLPELEPDANLFKNIKLKLFDLFRQRIETSMSLESNALSIVNHKIVDIINEWIEIKQDDLDNEK